MIDLTKTVGLNLHKRSRAEIRFQSLGIISILISLSFLAWLLITILAGSLGAAKHVEININISSKVQSHKVQTGVKTLPNVKNIIAIASGKGGVGKSTIAANLAIALSLSEKNYKVGLCDCDLYGPSIPLMFGKEDARPMATDENEIIPIESHGLKLMSMGFLLDDSSPVIVRGPLATRYTQQFLKNCQWGELDYLVLDLPPGTGDIQLTIAQSVAVDGAVIVTTPQEMALIDARKAASMFTKVNIPILGIIENMSYFLCPSDGKKYAIFGEDGVERTAKEFEKKFLGQIPINSDVGKYGDLSLIHI